MKRDVMYKGTAVAWRGVCKTNPLGTNLSLSRKYMVYTIMDAHAVYTTFLVMNKRGQKFLQDPAFHSFTSTLEELLTHLIYHQKSDTDWIVRSCETFWEGSKKRHSHPQNSNLDHWGWADLHIHLCVVCMCTYRLCASPLVPNHQVTHAD